MAEEGAVRAVSVSVAYTEDFEEGATRSAPCFVLGKISGSNVRVFVKVVLQ